MTDTPNTLMSAAQRRYLDAIFSLTEGEDSPRMKFEAMAEETCNALAAAGKPSPAPFYITPQSAFCFSAQEYRHAFVPPALLERWKRWEAGYPSLLLRNPKLELHDALCWCSETHDASGWPYGWEREIHDWVAAGNLAPLPFDDRLGIITDDFYARLRHLRAAVDGWLVWDERAACVVHVPASKWGQ